MRHTVYACLFAFAGYWVRGYSPCYKDLNALHSVFTLRDPLHIMLFGLRSGHRLRIPAIHLTRVLPPHPLLPSATAFVFAPHRVAMR